MASSPISTPKGGGAVSGLGEKFSPDLFTGTGNFSVPVALPPGRNGFQPELGLQYSTGSGNSPFGLGWNLSVPGVMRKTAKGVPRYDDERDTFILSGAEDLIAVKRMNIRFVQGGNNSVTNNAAGIIPLQNESGIITQYRPRTEGLFARVYHLKTNLRNCWKVMSKNGLTSWYGSKGSFQDDLSLVQKPDYPSSIFAWKLTRTEDTFGNHILYTYWKEAIKQNDYHIWDQSYLKEIKYADYNTGGNLAYMVRVEFNYETRTDAFSDFKSGFDIRTTQRCQTICIYTNPIGGEIKTRTYHFQYSDEVLPLDELPYNGVSLLCKVEVEGHDGLVSEFLPPLEFRYTHFKPKQQKFKQLEGKEMPLASLANPGFELVDLFGSGLPDIVQINGVVRYWRNLGDGKFDIPRLMKDAPTGFTLGDPDVQLVDANGDGRTDLLVNGTNMAGYFSMKHNASWDTKAFKKYKQAPTFSFADPEVKMLDLTGDGITDVLRNGTAFECFFHDKNDGWVETKRVPKKQIEGFPDVSFADPRIKLADMSGDGLQDIVQVYSGSVKYWPNLGYGNFGKPVVMKNAPRFQHPFDSTRLQLADIDGDGQADLIYVDSNKITFWINQSGNGWSEPFEITGTPFVTNINGIRIADIYGSGVSGVFYSFDALANTQRNRWFFLDLTGGTKPYLLHEMDNNMGSLTRVSYLPSTRYYLADQYGMSAYNPDSARVFAKRKPWKTTLPFPVQVVSRVEVIDELSKGKLTTEYHYHHGHWDGGEREFRGFGRVDQRDTETFERYNTTSATPSPTGQSSDNSFNSSFVSNDGHELQFTEVIYEHYSPPVETRNWFHLGPIGDEFGDWAEIGFSDEYWQEDPNVLTKEPDTFHLLQTLPRRAKRDALRAWRGSSLRSELYALDEQDGTGNYIAGSEGRPYTVSESQYGIRLEASPEANSIASPLGSEVLWIPKETSGYVFFSFATSSRTTQWERGYEPMTQFSFTTGFDTYGQPSKQLSAGLPRGIMPPYSTGIGTSPADEGNVILSTASVTAYAQKDTEATFIVDRTFKAISYEVVQQNGESVFAMRNRVFSAVLPVETGNIIYPIIGFSVNYYDAPDEFGSGLALGEIGEHGALARSETLVLTDDILIDAYGSKPQFFKFSPEVQNFSTYPTDFISSLQNGDTNLGYKKHTHADDANYVTGYYAESGRTKYDWQDALNTNPKGLVLETRDVFQSRASIEYDNYLLLPVTAKQWLNNTDYLATSAEYDYRVMQAKKITDPNGNRVVFDFSPLGLLKQSGVIGKPNANEGDIITESPFAYKPSVLMEYDFFAFKNDGNPVWVKTIQREKHYTQDANSPEIIKTEYTDGFGRLLQTRTQAEDVIFGDPIFGDSGLPETQGQNANAVGIQRGANDPLNVVVSGWKIYNNKGKVVEQYEPYFDKGFDYSPPFDLSALLLGIQSGEKIRMYYDPRGNVIRTVNPDNSEQWVIHGRPNTLESVAINNSWSFKNYTPTPWESYTYDANDLATRTNSTSYGHDFTPGNSVVDALGRTVKTTSRLTQNTSGDVVMKYSYDIQGNNLSVIDALNRVVFQNKFNLNKKALYTNHIDGGEKYILPDVAGRDIQATDDKGAFVLNSFDTTGRPKKIFAKDKTTESFTQRQHIIYGDESGVPDALANNLLGKPYQHFDEAGLTQFENYDYKGNATEKFRKVISDTEILSVFSGGTVNCYRVDWSGLNTTILDTAEYRSAIEYDALNRSIKVIYPESVDSKQKVCIPTYNKAGALQKIELLDDINGTSTTYVNHIAYNAKGQKLLVAWNNNVMMRFTYDKKTFRLKKVKAEKYTYTQNNNEHTYAYNSGTTRYDQTYMYDLVGNVLSVTDKTPDCGLPTANNELQKLFEYDSLYRLIYANGREMTNQNDSYLFADAPQIGNPTANDCRYYEQEYEYDKVGNIIKLKHRVDHNTSEYYTRVFEYQNGNNKLSKVRNGSNTIAYSEFTYDDNGNTTGNNSDRNYEWDYGDKLRSFYISASGSISQYTHYLYDAAGNRVKKITRKNNGTLIESIIYIDGGFEHHKKNTEEKNYLQIQGGVEKRIGAFVGDMSDTLTELDIYHITDYLSSATIRLHDDGSEIDREEYYPYGDTAVRSFTQKRYRFTGKEKDEESGLYYMNARYYASWCNKFLSIDPLAAKYAGQSPYVYANCNPLKFNDPSGMEGDGQTGATTQAQSTQGSNNTSAQTNTQNIPTTYNWSSAPQPAGATVGSTDKSVNTHGPQPANKTPEPSRPLTKDQLTQENIAKELAKTSNGILETKVDNVNIVIMKNPTPFVVESGALQTFTGAAESKDTPQATEYVTNGQLYESSLTGFVTQGETVENGTVVSGRSSPQTYNMTYQSNNWTFSKGDPNSAAQAAWGGGIPVIINNLPFGVVNTYSANAPQGLPNTGDPGSSNNQYLTQRSNSGFKDQENRGDNSGKVVIGLEKDNNFIVIIAQQDGVNGMKLSEIRDLLLKMGVENALSFDGSTSATLVKDNNVVVTPSSSKNATIPTGIGFRIKN